MLNTYSLLIFAFTTLVTAYIYPEHIPFHRRQAPGTPAYDCHANCGTSDLDPSVSFPSH